jgi:hypothetical protein
MALEVPLPEILANHKQAVLWGGGLFFLFAHFWGRGKATLIPFSWAIASIVGLMFVVLWANPEPIEFGIATGALFVYGVTLFILISDMLFHKGGARFLTRKRGENWTKEIDYLYLGIGSLGIVFSINRIDIVIGRFQGTDIIAPLLLTTAVVFRVIKTRAEIGGWSKLPKDDNTTSDA